jgi:hypothetical protein
MAQANAIPINRATLDSVFAHFNERVANVRAYNGPVMPVLEDEPIAGKIWVQLRGDQKLELVSNFNEAEFINIYQQVLPFVADASRRGPKPKSSLIDALIIYLAWAKSGLDYPILAKLLGLKESHCEDDVRRMRPLLHATLTDTWFTH